MSETDNGTKATPPIKAPRHHWRTLLIGYVKRKFHQRRTKKNHENPTDRAARRTATATVWMAVFTVVLATVSGLTLLVLKSQLKEMHEGGVDTHNLAAAAHDQVTQLTKQAGDTHDLAVAAGKQADAAKALADLTAKQVTSNQELIDSQRASVSVSFGRVINPITFHDGAPSIVFSILIQNAGAIKATHVAVRFKPYYSLWGNAMFTEPLQKQRDYCATPAPQEADWGWQDGKRVNLKGLRDWTITIEPHAPFERQLNFGMGKPTEAEIIKWPPADAVQRDPARVVTDRIFPVVVGCVDYQSGAMPEKHQTGFIFEVQEVYSDPLVPNAAPTFIHYGVDLPRERVIISPFFFGQGKQY